MITLPTDGSHHLYVLLDAQAKIVKITTNIQSLQYLLEDSKNLNWFDHFVESSDRKYASDIFQKILVNEINETEIFSYDIISVNHKHEFIDFRYEVQNINEDTYVLFIGTPHYEVHKINFSI